MLFTFLEIFYMRSAESMNKNCKMGLSMHMLYYTSDAISQPENLTKNHIFNSVVKLSYLQLPSKHQSSIFMHDSRKGKVAQLLQSFLRDPLKKSCRTET